MFTFRVCDYCCAAGGQMLRVEGLRLRGVLVQDDPACADASTSYFVRQAPDAGDPLPLPLGLFRN